MSDNGHRCRRRLRRNRIELVKIAARKTTVTAWSTRRLRRAALLALDDQAMELVAIRRGAGHGGVAG
jgi:hypothetical protein